jgi:hypothetical protein
MVYNPSGSGNTHTEKVLKNVSVGFPKGKTKKVLKPKKVGKKNAASTGIRK